MSKYFSLKDFEARFPDDASCLEEIKQLRFGNEIDCPKCVRQNRFYRVKGRTAYACSFCGWHIYPLKGTPFAHSSTPLKTWFIAINYMAQTRSGMSAKNLERLTGVTYKCAFRMFHQIRKLMAEDGMQLFNEVEVDEMYMHPDPKKNSRVQARKSLPGKRFYESETVLGMVERGPGGRAKAFHVKSSGSRVLIPEIRKHIAPSSVIYTDEYRTYGKLAVWGYLHFTVNHSKAQYVDGHRHTQNIECLWSNAKRGIRGVYRHVSPHYLQAYIDEYTFRSSYRNVPKQMFDLILMNVAVARR